MIFKYLFSLGLLFFLVTSCASDSNSADQKKVNGEGLVEGEAMFPYYKKKMSFPRRFRMRLGYMDCKGKRVIPNRYIYAHVFTENLGCVAIWKDGRVKYGYIDPRGNYIIKPQFKEARPFVNGRALVRDELDNWFVIDKKGKQLSEAKFSRLSTNYLGAYCYGYVHKKTTQHRGFLGMRSTTSYYDCYKIDRDGNETLIGVDVTDLRQRDTFGLNELSQLGLYWENDANGDRIYGYKKIGVDEYDQSPWSSCGNYVSKGVIQIKAQYPHAGCFEGGYARVLLNSGKSAYINTNGKVLFTFKDRN